MITIEYILNKCKLHPFKVKNIYLFGSRCYNTFSDKSDYDVLIIANTPYEETEVIVDDLNIHILSLDRFLYGLKTHNIRNIECLFSPYILKNEINITYEIDIPGFRHSISHIVSNSWIKSKKKIENDNYYIGIKSLFHSIRIAMFAIQIIKYGEIVDWECANKIWNELTSKEWKWEELNHTYKPIRNALMTEFRKLTIK